MSAAPPPASVLARASRLLDAVERHGPIATLADLTADSGLPRSTTHRLCGELVDLELLVQEKGGYRLGERLQTLGRAVPRALGLRDVARPHMEDLRLVSGGATVQLVVLSGVDIVHLEVMRASHPPRVGARAGARLPAHATASGKALLAYSPPEAVQARIDAGLIRLTTRTLGTPLLLRRDLATIRARGIALDREECAIGLSSVAAPVFTRGERVVAALSLSGLAPRSLPTLAPAVRMGAIAMSRSLGAFAHPVGGSSHSRRRR